MSPSGFYNRIFHESLPWTNTIEFPVEESVKNPSTEWNSGETEEAAEHEGEGVLDVSRGSVLLGHILGNVADDKVPVCVCPPVLIPPRVPAHQSLGDAGHLPRLQLLPQLGAGGYSIGDYRLIYFELDMLGLTS